MPIYKDKFNKNLKYFQRMDNTFEKTKHFLAYFKNLSVILFN